MTTTSLFDLDEFKPCAGRWFSRQRELARRYAYYAGTVYASARQRLGWLYPRLHQHIRPLYLPLARAINVDAGIIPGLWTLAPDAQHLEPAVRQVLVWSDWSTDGVLYTHYGSLYGACGLRIADLRAEGRVLIRAVPPTVFMLARAGRYDSSPRLALWIERAENRGLPGIVGDTFEYAEVIEPDRVRTFANGQPVGFEGRPPEYANALGFVPFIEVSHINVGEELGDCAFQRSVALLDEVNEVATWLAEIIRKHAEPQWAVIGSDATELAHSGDNVWFIPAGGDVKVLVPGIDLAGVLKFLQEIRVQVEASLPELAFDDLRSKDQIATATMELQLMELTLLIQRVRPNYDHGLVHALRMCGRAAAGMGNADALRLVAQLDDDALAFDPRRPVLPVDAKTSLELQKLEKEVKTMKG